MAAPDRERSRASGGSNVEAAAASGAPPQEGFPSILFAQPAHAADVEEREEPACFPDLNLDQVVGALIAGREQYALRPFFHAPLDDAAAVRYRQEVLRDLEQRAIRDAVAAFAESMRQVRAHRAQAEELYYPLQRQAWFLDSAELYCRAVRALAGRLGELGARSRGLRGFLRYLDSYVGSPRFADLERETQAVKAALAGVRYALHLRGARVTVARYEGEEDYSVEVEQTFAKFKQGAARSYLVELVDSAAMDHVEAQVLDRVARLYPEVFRSLAAYCDRHRGYLDATIARFDREVQFYLAYLELVERLRAAGLPFCYPEVVERPRTVEASDAFDLALAVKLVAEGRRVVCNDFRLEHPERVIVVTGPNNGGKTTFARTFGQLHYLGSLGVLVPGSRARLALPDRVCTHFEKEEDIETLRGKFEDELVRVREILERATDRSVIVMNESFSSTSLHDALFVGTEVMRRILALGCLCVYVTFVDELASLGEATVSMVSQIAPGNPAERTYKVVRQRADGLAYAWAIAEKYGLTYERLLDRIGR